MDLSQTRSTVIIGLGGTGRWVLTGIKKNLLEIHRGKLPPQVRLLSFDTVEEQSSANGPPIEPVQIGGVQLDAAEYIHLGGRIYDLCQQISDDEEVLPHIRSWLQADSYLKRLVPNDFTISRGSGQRRPFGRMALFLDLQAHNQSIVANRIKQALQEVSIGDSKVGVYIAASLSGGTGSGMFIDIAHLVRVIADQQQITLRGFLVLQNTFSSVQRLTHVEPNTGAALRELDRFMHIFNQSYTIAYNPAIPDRGKTVYGEGRGRLFDGCYLIDADRDRNPLVRYDPNVGVYPSIADSITTLIDPGVAAKFDDDVSNITQRSSNAQLNKDTPHYSSIGSYTLIFPAEDIITSLSYRFARELLSDWLLQIKIQEQDATRTVSIHYEGNPKYEALTFLQRPQGQDNVESTNFLMWAPSYVDNVNNKEAVAEVANQTTEHMASWLAPTLVSEDTATRTSGKLIAELLRQSLTEEIENNLSWGASNQEIIAQVIQFREKIFGYEQDGHRVGGKYTAILETCVKEQQQRYRQLLTHKLQELLKNSDDLLLQNVRRGKLGFIRDFLRALSEGFDRLAAFFEHVKSDRNGQLNIISPRQGLQQDVDDAREQMIQHGSNTLWRFVPTLLFDSLAAPQLRKNYIEAEHALISYQMGDWLLNYLQKTAIVLRDTTKTFREAVEHWTRTLVEGFSGTVNDLSLYQRLVEAEEAHARNRNKQKVDDPVHEYVTSTAYEEMLYVTLLRDKLSEAMATFQWSIEVNSQGLVEFKLNQLRISRADSNHNTRERDHHNNMSYLLGLARPHLEEELRNKRIADLIESLETNPELLARRLHTRCSPLLSFNPNLASNQEFHYYVCLQEDRKHDFFARLPAAFRQITNQALDYEVVPSADPHRCTILATADVIPSTAIHACIKASKSYDAYHHDGRLLHVFPAEVNAVYYEQRLPEIFQERRRFNMRLAAMLEDQLQIKQFILCFLYAFIDLQPVGSAESRYVLTLDVPDLIRDASVRQWPTSFALTPASSEPSLATAIETFIFKQTDIDNSAMSILPRLIDYTLRQHEAQISGGTLHFHQHRQIFSINYEPNDDGEGRLIAQIKNCLDARLRLIQPQMITFGAPPPDLRLARDLAALISLIVQDIIQGIKLRKAARQQQHNQSRLMLADHNWIEIDPSGGIVPTKINPFRSSSNGMAPINISSEIRYFSGGLVGAKHDFDSERTTLEELRNRGTITPNYYDHRIWILDIEQALAIAYENVSNYDKALVLLEDAHSRRLINLDNHQTLERIIEIDRLIFIGAANKQTFDTLSKRIDQLRKDGTLTDEEQELRQQRLQFDGAWQGKLISQELYAQAIKHLANRWSTLPPKTFAIV